MKLKILLLVVLVFSLNTKADIIDITLEMDFQYYTNNQDAPDPFFGGEWEETPNSSLYDSDSIVDSLINRDSLFLTLRFNTDGAGYSYFNHSVNGTTERFLEDSVNYEYLNESATVNDYASVVLIETNIDNFSFECPSASQYYSVRNHVTGEESYNTQSCSQYWQKRHQENYLYDSVTAQYTDEIAYTRDERYSGFIGGFAFSLEQVMDVLYYDFDYDGVIFDWNEALAVGNKFSFKNLDRLGTTANKVLQNNGETYAMPEQTYRGEATVTSFNCVEGCAVSEIPEPSNIAMFALALLGIGAKRCRLI